MIFKTNVAAQSPLGSVQTKSNVMSTKWFHWSSCDFLVNISPVKKNTNWFILFGEMRCSENMYLKLLQRPCL